MSASKGLANQIEQVAAKLVTEYWNDNSRDILGILADSFLEEHIALNIDDKTPLEAMAEEAPPRAEIAKSAKPSVLQKLHSYEKESKAEPRKTIEEVR